MTKWALRAEIRASRNKEFLHPPSAPDLFMESIPAKDCLIPACLPFLEPATQSSQPQPILSSSECNQDPSDSYTRFLLGSPANASSTLLPLNFLKWRDYHDHQTTSSFRSSSAHPPLPLFYTPGSALPPRCTVNYYCSVMCG